MEGLAYQHLGAKNVSHKAALGGIFGIFLPPDESETTGKDVWGTPLKQSFWKKPSPSETLQTTEEVQQRDKATTRADREDGIFNALSSFYTILDPAVVRTFLTDHRKLRSFLFSALPKIKESFGNPVTTELRLIEDMEDNLLRLRVSIISSRLDARQALEQFDENWWLDQVQNAEGLLDFTLRR